MGRRRWNKKHPDKARAQQQHQRRPEDAADPPVRLLALQPNSTVVGVAMGNRVTFVDYKTGEEVRLAVPAPAEAAGAAAAAAETVATTSAAAAPGPHAGILRVLQFSPDGQFLLTGADDKAARLWATGEGAAAAGSGGAWRCAAAWRTPKKTSVGGFSLDGIHALFADKFGDVLVGRAPAPAAAAAEGAVSEPPLQAPSTLLGHFCTIVTALAPSPCGRFLATGDREYKVRVSWLPEDLQAGSYEIQGYCFGHQDFVSCVAFAIQRDEQNQGDQAPAKVPGRSVLLSGSGDGTVRVWDYEACTQLSSYVASAPAAAGAAPAAAAAGAGGEGSSAPEEAGGEEASGGGDEGDDEGDGAEADGGEEGPSAGAGAGQGEADGEGGEGAAAGGGGFVEPQRRSKAPACPPVLSLAVSPDGSTVAVVVEGDDEVQLLDLNWATSSLELRQRLRWPDVRYPCQVAFGPTGQLWVVGGVPMTTAQSAHIGVAQRGPDGSFVTCTAEVVSPAARSLLEARVEEEEAKMAEGGELFVYSKRLRRPAYDEEEVQTFKRKRNDYKETQRLAALRLRQDELAKQKQGQGQPNGGAVEIAPEAAAA
ncbi:hypothetical protein PLESTB_001754000 [Pleodorina starrii]|uniref:Uncharacterized protein n=1 Tax=Pleodorina starrii TaxID=330485 RepID=A0A9W6C0B4_9CHLO|nr:hypothetical protein PLESTM_000595900 [Pleodorina starrii]GLC61413.1 hypothetical protein PLESTB_001754000 [Pleodorina starrii]GLC74059.1 hypothetical protein PLESTF_001455500 [Pleodorina starrii]